MSSTFQSQAAQFAEELRQLCEKYLAIIQTFDCGIEFNIVDGDDHQRVDARCELHASFNGVSITNLDSGEVIEAERADTLNFVQDVLGIYIEEEELEYIG